MPATPAFLDLDPDNLAGEHLCCALADAKHAEGVERKRRWLRRQMARGLRFRKLDVRGKVFIEYMPAEACWRPIVAPGFLVVHCLWVSGRFQGQGYGRALVEHALEDAAASGRRGLVVAAGKTKRPFLSDPRFLRHLGFDEVDRRDAWRLFAKSVPGDPGGPAPRFAATVRESAGPLAGPHRLAHNDQCPFNAHWAEAMATSLRERGVDVRVERLTRAADARRVASPLGAFSFERRDGLVAHHLLTDAAVGRLLEKRGTRKR